MYTLSLDFYVALDSLRGENEGEVEKWRPFLGSGAKPSSPGGADMSGAR